MRQPRARDPARSRVSVSFISPNARAHDARPPPASLSARGDTGGDTGPAAKVIPEVIPARRPGDTGGDTLLTLKASEELVDRLEALAKDRGLTRHAAALEALAVGIEALRGRGDTGGDTASTRAVIPEVIPGASAFADLVAKRVVDLLAGPGLQGAARAPAEASGRAKPGKAVTSPLEASEEAPESRSGRAPGLAPRRPGDYRIGGRRKSDPPEGSVGALLLTWRRARDLSQKEAAEVFNVDRKTWQRWETGERYPEAAVVERIRTEVSGGEHGGD